MANKAVLLLYLNLGGEMVYIIAHRLRAQKIERGRSRQILSDVINTFLNEEILSEISCSKKAAAELYSKAAMRTVFEKLCHSSLMRLNSESIDRLYDLMLMAVKYQIVFCPRAADLLLVTLNHLDELYEIASATGESSDSLQTCVDNAFRFVLKTYSNVSMGEWTRIRQTMQNLFLETRIKISLFLREKLQYPDSGHFIIPPAGGTLPTGFESPGIIRILASGQTTRTVEFNPGARFKLSWKDGATGRFGDRVLQLGKNIYVHGLKIDVVGPVQSQQDGVYGDVQPSSRQQVDLLAAMVGTPRDRRSSNGIIKLSLFNSAEDEDESADDFLTSRTRCEDRRSSDATDFPDQRSPGASKIQASHRISNELSRIMRDLDF